MLSKSDFSNICRNYINSPKFPKLQFFKMGALFVLKIINKFVFLFLFSILVFSITMFDQYVTCDVIGCILGLLSSKSKSTKSMHCV